MTRSLGRRQRTSRTCEKRWNRLRLEELECRVTPTVNISVLVSFPARIDLGNGLTLNSLNTSIVSDSMGNLFGGALITDARNEKVGGTIFELVKGSTTFTTLASFNEDTLDGYPTKVIVDSNDNIYGTTSTGGPDGDGTVFKLAAGSHTITTLGSFSYQPGFDSTDGYGFNPNNLLLSGNTLFGTTSGGGLNGFGAIFSLPITGGDPNTFASFNGDNGSGPSAGLIQSGGTLYGTTNSGGDHGMGTVYSCPINSDGIAALSSFSNFAGQSQLVLMNGSLFGTSTLNGGNVYSVSTTGGPINVVSNFNNTNGAVPSGGLAMDGGTPIGVTNLGGTIGHGSLFALAPNGSIVPLASFVGSNGGAPGGPPSIDGAGNIYGTAQGEGGSSTLVVWEASGLAVPQISFSDSPSFGSLGQSLSTVKVALTNAPAGSSVTLALNSSVQGAKLSGTLIEPVINSIATFPGLSINVPGQGYSLTATGAGISVTSNPFTVGQVSAITTPNIFTFTVGSTGSFTVKDVGFPAPTLSETGNLPSGVTFSASTGVLSGKPAAGTAGVYPLTFTAANGFGANAKQNFTLVVNQPAPAGATTSSVSGSVYYDLNANGSPSAGEPTLAGRTVFVDKNGNGVPDSGELSAVTNSAGAFTINNIPAGIFTLRVFVFPGDVVTGPGAGSYPLQATTPTTWTGLSLGIQPASIITPVQPSAAPFGVTNPNRATAEIVGLYTLILNRPADAAGLAGWVAALNTGTTISQIAATFLRTPERFTNEVQGYYLTFLGRPGDAGGVQSWVAAMQAGFSEQQVVNAFLMAPEFSQVHASNSAFVQALYADLLGRTAALPEIVGWDNFLNSGSGRNGLILAVVGSFEAQKRAIDSYYVAFLGRQTDSAGEAFWVNSVLSGAATLDGVAASIFGSPEFANRAGGTVG